MCQTAPGLRNSRCTLGFNFPFHLGRMCCPEVQNSETKLYSPYHCKNLDPSLNSMFVRQPYAFSIVNRIDDLQRQECRLLLSSNLGSKKYSSVTETCSIIQNQITAQCKE